MGKILFSAKFLLFLVLFPAFVLAGEGGEDQFSALIYADDYPVSHMEPLQYEQFSMLEREIQHMIFRDGENSHINNFCVVGYAFADQDKEVVIFWKEKKVLILWRGGDYEAAKERFKWAFSIYHATRIGEKNLYDKLPDPPYFLGGDKLATRSGFYATIEDCEQHGRQYRIPVFTLQNDEEAP